MMIPLHVIAAQLGTSLEAVVTIARLRYWEAGINEKSEVSAMQYLVIVADYKNAVEAAQELAG